MEHILSKRNGMSDYRAIGMRTTYLNRTRKVASLNQGVWGVVVTYIYNISYDYKAFSFP